MPTSAAELDHEAPRATRRMPRCPVCAHASLDLLLDPDGIRAEERWMTAFHRARVAGGPESAKDRVDFTQSPPIAVVRCTSCETVFRDPQPTCSALRDTYARDDYGQPALERLAASQGEFFAAKLDALEPTLRDLRPGACVLEIGSFVGGFLSAARQRGWRAIGVDIGEETTTYMRRRGFEVLRGDVVEITLPRASFDAVFVWNTFDQLCNPAAVLERCHALLRPRGLFVVRVPNGRFASACIELRRRFPGTRREQRVLAAQAYNNFLTFPYLTAYTPESLDGLLSRHGLEPLLVRGDTISRLAGPDTLPFAVREEERYVRAVHRACSAAARATGRVHHPWIDVIARERGVPASATASSLARAEVAM